MHDTVEQRLQQLGLTLPTPLGPIGSYCPYKRVGNLIFFSGQGPMYDKIPQYTGRVGQELTLEQGYEASKLTALNVLAVIKSAVGDFSNVKQFVSVMGFVNCVDGFTDTPQVLNGFSDLINELFGECGAHARCALPSSTLPMNTPVEIQAIIEVREDLL